MKLRPYVLKYTLKTPTAGPTRNDDGDLIQGAETTVLIEESCRVQPNVRGSYFINESDGSKLEFNSTVFLDRACAIIPIGQQVEIFNGDTLILSGTVKRFNQGQLQTRAWI